MESDEKERNESGEKERNESGEKERAKCIKKVSKVEEKIFMSDLHLLIDCSSTSFNL